MIAATMTSGHPVPVPNTPSAARSTARLPSTSFRVQIQAERIFASPSRCEYRMPNDAALAASAVIWVILLGVLAYRKLSISYRLTTQRFIHQAGILSRVTNRIEVLDMDDVTFQQGIVDRIMGTGTITILSSDKSHPKLVLKGIDNVQNVSELIDNTRRSDCRD